MKHKRRALRKILCVVILVLLAHTAMASVYTKGFDGRDEGKPGYIIQFDEEPIIAFRSEMIREPFESTVSGGREATLSQKVSVHGQALERRHEIAKHDIEQLLRREPYVVAEFTNIFNGIVLDITPREAWRLKSLPYVKSVFPNHEVSVTLDQSAPQIGAPELWAKGYDGTGITIAIIDTGIDYTHPDLGSCFGPGCKVVDGYDFVNLDADPMDDYGHGTHVAGIASANGLRTGVAPGSNLVAYKVLDENGRGLTSDVIAAIERATDPNQDSDTSDHYDIISLSLGSNVPYSPVNPEIIAIENAIEAGVVVTVAAGNCGEGCPSSTCGSYRGVGTPGSSPSAITVGAVDKSDQWSCYSSGEDIPGVGVKPDVSAPGSYINSTVPAGGCPLSDPSGYASVSGTSMATPHVAGAVALLLDANPTLTPGDVKQRLMDSAIDLGEMGKDTKYGAGRVELTNILAPILDVHPEDIDHHISTGTLISDHFTIYNKGEEPLIIDYIVKEYWIDFDESLYTGYVLNPFLSLQIDYTIDTSPLYKTMSGSIGVYSDVKTLSIPVDVYQYDGDVPVHFDLLPHAQDRQFPTSTEWSYRTTVPPNGEYLPGLDDDLFAEPSFTDSEYGLEAPNSNIIVLPDGTILLDSGFRMEPPEPPSGTGSPLTDGPHDLTSIGDAIIPGPPTQNYGGLGGPPGNPPNSGSNPPIVPAEELLSGEFVDSSDNQVYYLPLNPNAIAGPLYFDANVLHDNGDLIFFHNARVMPTARMPEGEFVPLYMSAKDDSESGFYSLAYCPIVYQPDWSSPTFEPLYPDAIAAYEAKLDERYDSTLDGAPNYPWINKENPDFRPSASYVFKEPTLCDEIVSQFGITTYGNIMEGYSEPCWQNPSGTVDPGCGYSDYLQPESHASTSLPFMMGYSAWSIAGMYGPVNVYYHPAWYQPTNPHWMPPKGYYLQSGQLTPTSHPLVGILTLGFAAFSYGCYLAGVMNNWWIEEPEPEPVILEINSFSDDSSSWNLVSGTLEKEIIYENKYYVQFGENGTRGTGCLDRRDCGLYHAPPEGSIIDEEAEVGGFMQMSHIKSTGSHESQQLISLVNTSDFQSGFEMVTIPFDVVVNIHNPSHSNVMGEVRVQAGFLQGGKPYVMDFPLVGLDGLSWSPSGPKKPSHFTWSGVLDINAKKYGFDKLEFLRFVTTSEAWGHAEVTTSFEAHPLFYHYSYGTNSIPTVEVDDLSGNPPILSGRASDSDGTVSKVEVKINGNDWQTATGKTSWSYTLPTLSSGRHYIRVRASDGEAHSIVQNMVVVLNYRPTISATPDPISSTVIRFDGTTVDQEGDIIDWVKYRIDDGTWNTVTDDGGWTTWHYDWDVSSLSSGTHYIYFQASAAGGTQFSDIISLGIIVNIPPVVRITSVQLAAGDIVIQGTAHDDDGTVDSVYVSIDEGPENLATDTTSWTYTWTSPTEGTHTITAIAYDDQGGASMYGIGIELEFNPYAWVESIRSFNHTNMIFEGKAFDFDDEITLVQVKLDSGSYQNAADISGDWSRWEYDWDISSVLDGTHTIYSKARNEDNLWSTEMNGTFTFNRPPIIDTMVNMTYINDGTLVSFNGSTHEDYGDGVANVLGIIDPVNENFYLDENGHLDASWTDANPLVGDYTRWEWNWSIVNSPDENTDHTLCIASYDSKEYGLACWDFYLNRPPSISVDTVSANWTHLCYEGVADDLHGGVTNGAIDQVFVTSWEHFNSATGDYNWFPADDLVGDWSRWNGCIPLIAPGIHAFFARARDNGGANDYVGYLFEIDWNPSNPPPSLGLVSYAYVEDDVSTNIRFEGTASDPNGVQSIEFAFDDPLVWFHAAGTTSWVYLWDITTWPDDNTDHNVFIKACDTLGACAIYSFTMLVDRPPHLTWWGYYYDYTADYLIFLIGSADDDHPSQVNNYVTNGNVTLVEAKVEVGGVLEDYTTAQDISLDKDWSVWQYEWDATDVPDGTSYDFSVKACDKTWCLWIRYSGNILYRRPHVEITDYIYLDSSNMQITGTADDNHINTTGTISQVLVTYDDFAELGWWFPATPTSPDWSTWEYLLDISGFAVDSYHNFYAVSNDGSLILGYSRTAHQPISFVSPDVNVDQMTYNTENSILFSGTSDDFDGQVQRVQMSFHDDVSWVDANDLTGDWSLWDYTWDISAIPENPVVPAYARACDDYDLCHMIGGDLTVNRPPHIAHTSHDYPVWGWIRFNGTSDDIHGAMSGVITQVYLSVDDLYPYYWYPATDTGGGTWSTWSRDIFIADIGAGEHTVYAAACDDGPGDEMRCSMESETFSIGYPIADAGPDQSVGVNDTVGFDGSGSYDPDGYIVRYEWDFGDGQSHLSEIGDSWANTGFLSGATYIKSLLQAFNGTIYAGTGPNGDVFKTTNGGGTWTNTGDLAGAETINSIIQASDTTLYAATYPNGEIFKSTNGGDTWTSIATLPGTTNVMTLLQASDGALYAGTYPDGNVFKSIDNGGTWANTANLPGAGTVQSLLEATDGTIYAGTSPQSEVFKTTDGGNSWIRTGDIPQIHTHDLLQATDGTIYAATYPAAVYKSVNGGDTWTITGSLSGAHTVYCLLQASQGTLYAGTYGNGDVYKSNDGGGTWTNTGELDFVHYVFDIIQAYDGALYAGTSSTGRVYKSVLPPSPYASHIYSSPGTYVVSLTVTDNDNLTDTDTAIVTVGYPPVADVGPRLRAEFTEAGYKDVYLALPRDAEVTSASLDITGYSNTDLISAFNHVETIVPDIACFYNPDNTALGSIYFSIDREVENPVLEWRIGTADMSVIDYQLWTTENNPVRKDHIANVFDVTFTPWSMNKVEFPGVTLQSGEYLLIPMYDVDNDGNWDYSETFRTIRYWGSNKANGGGPPYNVNERKAPGYDPHNFSGSVDFKVYGEDFPHNATLDVGADGDIEWDTLYLEDQTRSGGSSTCMGGDTDTNSIWIGWFYSQQPGKHAISFSFYPMYVVVDGIYASESGPAYDMFIHEVSSLGDTTGTLLKTINGINFLSQQWNDFDIDLQPSEGKYLGFKVCMDLNDDGTCDTDGDSLMDDIRDENYGTPGTYIAMMGHGPPYTWYARYDPNVKIIYEGYPDGYNGTETVAGIEGEINDYLATCGSDPCMVPLRLSSQSGGILEITNINLNLRIPAGTTVYFNGNASYDPDGYIVKYDWDFGDSNYFTSELGRIWQETGYLGGGRAMPIIENVDGTIFVGTTLNGKVYKSDDGGTTWVETGELVDSRDVLALIETSDGSLYAGTMTHNSTGISYKSVDGGATWINGTPTEHVQIIRYLLRASDGYFYATTFGGGPVLRSSDGLNWQETGAIPGVSLAHDLLETSDGTIFVTTYHGEILYKTTDGGTTWTPAGDFPSYVRDSEPIIETSAGTLLAGVEQEPINRKSYIYRSTDNGDTWEQVLEVDLAHITSIYQIGGGVIYAAFSKNGAIYRSTDDGQTWQLLSYPPLSMTSDFLYASDGALYLSGYIAQGVNTYSKVVKSTTTALANHTYLNPGIYTVSLTVTDNHGLTDTDTMTIEVY